MVIRVQNKKRENTFLRYLHEHFLSSSSVIRPS